MGPVEVNLRKPVPLDRELDLLRDADGSVRVIEGEALVAEAHSVPGVDVEVPAPVTPDEARAASASSPQSWSAAAEVAHERRFRGTA